MMKKNLTSICFSLGAASFSYAQSVAPAYSIAPWFNDKKAAVSLTFDDGISGQFAIAVPLLNQYGFTSTFFITPGILTSQLIKDKLIADAAKAGHEIANHSLTHPHFDSIAPADITSEIIQSNEAIKKYTRPGQSLTHAYPFGEGGQETEKGLQIRSIIKQYFIGARATRNKVIPFNDYHFAREPDDYFKINSDIIADSASMAEFTTHLDATISSGGWYVPCYHGIENGWLIVPKENFQMELQALQERKEMVWIATFENVLKYHRQRNCTKLRGTAENNDSWILELRDTLNNEATWNHPLTIHLKLNGRKVKSIRQGNKKILFIISPNEMIFNAVPGRNKIIVTKDK
ncbi:MAG: polysaccharide deacetylase family protein [Ferruginibacter sp.]